MSATRFAPSPTGHLHKGHAFSALTAFATAQALEARFVLRIEDIDFTRCRPHFEAAIFDDLAWLGLSWEAPVLRQSEHMDDYLAALETLKAARLVYRSFATRREVAEAMLSAPHGAPEGYRGAPLPAPRRSARLQPASLSPGGSTSPRRRPRPGVRPSPSWAKGRWASGAGSRSIRRLPAMWCWRGKTSASPIISPWWWTMPAQEITDVVRGQDLFEATHVQRLLQALLGLPEPRYRHHRLIAGADGRRLAKRDRAETLQSLKARGVTAAALRTELGFDPHP